MQQWGATPAQIDNYRKSIEESHCLVLEENWPALIWFLSIDDLFIRDSYSGRLCGLDVKAVQADAEMRGKDVLPGDYHKLRVIGRSATYEVNKKKAN